ncbi:MAG: tyrosine-type recombinase/integrase [Terriglobia bacterium]
MPTRHQNGYVYQKKNRWYVRYYDYVMQEDGSIKRLQVAKSLAPICYEYRTRRAVMPLVTELLNDVNSSGFRPESILSLERFIEENYLPYVSRQKRPSTYRGYRNIWRCYLKQRCGQVRLRDFRTADGERLLAEIARQRKLGRSSLVHIKNLLSGVFKYAKRLGAINGVNPVQDVSIPKARPSTETYAYSLEEIFNMISVSPYPASTIVATAAFTGLRKGEISGLIWENYHEDALWVTQSVWERFVSEPKTERSKAAIPVIAPLAKLLNQHRRAQGDPQAGFMFRSRPYSGEARAVDLKSLLKWQIKPKLERAGIEWHGWHAFRRGLATNLHRLGVPDKTIQAILRHSNISTTMNAYVKSVPADAVAAMRSLEAICTQYAPHLGQTENYVAQPQENK